MLLEISNLKLVFGKLKIENLYGNKKYIRKFVFYFYSKASLLTNPLLIGERPWAKALMGGCEAWKTSLTPSPHSKCILKMFLSQSIGFELFKNRTKFTRNSK